MSEALKVNQREKDFFGGKMVWETGEATPYCACGRRQLLDILPYYATMKSSLAIVLFVELGSSVWLASSTCILSHAFVRAARDVHEHPSSSAASTEFRRQQFLSEITPFVFGACVFGLLALPTVSMIALRHRRRHTATRVA
jgi:hypothetical protein